jgi:NADPH:quinone reductase-like Zn-dependent oxidoreductase
MRFLSRASSSSAGSSEIPINRVASPRTPLIRASYWRRQSPSFSGEHADLFVLKELLEAGKVTPVIDRTFPFEDTPAAVRYVETGRVRGKVAITV